MALDGAFLYAIKSELQPLIGGRVEKIHQPSREEIIISIRTRQGSRKVYISANAGSARVHITEKSVDNPQTPPMFCMLLRKRLGSGKLIDIRQDGLERILFLDFECVNELGDIVTVTLACEIMGRCSNLVVIGQDGREKTVRAGEAVVEMVGTIHHGENRGDKTVVLDMFYISQKGTPIAVQHPEIKK